MNLNRNIQLDGLRGFAVILIIIWHYGNNQLSNNSADFSHYFKLITSYCWSGVDLFFVLSGFLLGGILLRNKKSNNYFKAFYIRRICRIFPIYFLSLLAIICLIIIGYGQTTGQTTEWAKNSGVPFWSYFTFTQNIFMGTKATLGNRWLAHTWSLALEEQFYLILPLLIYFLNTRILLTVLLLAILASPIFRLMADNWYEAFNFLHCRFDALFTGVICAYLINNENSKAILKKHNYLLIGFLVVFVLIIILMSVKKIYLPHYLENSILSFSYSLLILILAGNFSQTLSNVFSNRILVNTGIISYGLYLFHQPISGLVHFYFFNSSPHINSPYQLIATMFSLGLSIALAYLSYHFLEKKFINYGHKHRY